MNFFKKQYYTVLISRGKYAGPVFEVSDNNQSFLPLYMNVGQADLPGRLPGYF